MKRTRDQGFTAIEMIVTVFVASMIVIAVSGLYSVTIRSSAVERNRADASDLAYANLRHYVFNGAKASNWFLCDPTNNSSNTNDLTQNPNAPGQELLAPADQTLSASQTTIPQPVTLHVVALSPYGCSGSNVGSPIMVRSTVTYGEAQDQVVHASYVGY